MICVGENQLCTTEVKEEARVGCTIPMRLGTRHGNTKARKNPSGDTWNEAVHYEQDVKGNECLRSDSTTCRDNVIR